MLPTIGNATLCGDRRGRGAKLKVFFFAFFGGARATLCGDRRGRGAKNSRFFALIDMPARPSAGIGVVEVQKLEILFWFLICPRDPLRRSAWSRCKNSKFWRFFDMPARPSAEIGVVEVQKLEVFFAFFAVPARPSAEIGVVEVQKLEVFLCFLRCPRGPLRRSCVSKCSRCGAARILLSLGEPSAEIVRVEALSLWRRAVLLLAKWPLEDVSWFARLQSRVRFPPGPRQLRLENRSF